MSLVNIIFRSSFTIFYSLFIYLTITINFIIYRHVRCFHEISHCPIFHSWDHTLHFISPSYRVPQFRRGLVGSIFFWCIDYHFAGWLLPLEKDGCFCTAACDPCPSLGHGCFCTAACDSCNSLGHGYFLHIDNLFRTSWQLSDNSL